MSNLLFFLVSVRHFVNISLCSCLSLFSGETTAQKSVFFRTKGEIFLSDIQKLDVSPGFRILRSNTSMNSALTVNTPLLCQIVSVCKQRSVSSESLFTAVIVTKQTTDNESRGGMNPFFTNVYSFSLSFSSVCIFFVAFFFFSFFAQSFLNVCTRHFGFSIRKRKTRRDELKLCF